MITGPTEANWIAPFGFSGVLREKWSGSTAFAPELYLCFQKYVMTFQTFF